MKSYGTLALSLIAFAASNASAATVVASSSVTTAFLWTVSFNSATQPGVQLQSVQFDLSTAGADVIFDSASGSPGYNPFVNFSVVTSNGISSVTGTPLGAALDGGKLFTINFTGFDPGEVLTFLLDVDRVDPCTGLSGIALIACQTSREVPTLGVMAGTKVNFTFGGGPWETKTASNTLSQGTGIALLTDVTSVETSITPEPGSVLMLSSGLLGLLGLARRRRG